MNYYTSIKMNPPQKKTLWINMDRSKNCYAEPWLVSQWIERQPINQKADSLIPSQGTCLDCGPGPQLGLC